jgi:hypothetical protein
LYNRYIPQPDGSYRKNRVPEAIVSPPQSWQPPPKAKTSAHKPANEPKCPPREDTCVSKPPPRQRHASNNHPPGNADSIIGFLKQLLPRDIDTADLLIILLLLLMAGDNEAERNNALLTLALYFFM